MRAISRTGATLMNGRRASAFALTAILACGLSACGDRGASDDAANTAETPVDEKRDTIISEPELKGLPAPKDPSRSPGTLGTLEESVQVIATISEWKIELSDDTIPAGEVTVAIENRGTKRHVIEVRSQYTGRWRSSPVPPGGVIMLSMPLSGSTYEVYDPEEDADGKHAEKGMRATLVVR
jgi:hypothetical protein